MNNVKVTIVLFITVMVSAMFVVHNSYEERRMFSLMENLKKEASTLKEENDRLEVQKRELSSTARITELATKGGMKVAEPATTIFIQDK